MSIKRQMNDKGISIVLGSFNRYKYLIHTVKSIRDEMDKSSIPYEIIVIDGGSSDRSISWLVKQKDIITIIQHNRGEWKGKPIVRRSWGYFMNIAFKAAQGKYICMLSDDCLVVPGAIINGYNRFEKKLKNKINLGALAFYFQEWPEQDFFKISIIFDNIVSLNHGLYLRQALDDINYIDEDNYLFYQADSDLCLRMIDAGYLTDEADDSFIIHCYHATPAIRKTNFEKQKNDLETFVKKWKHKANSEKQLKDFNTIFSWKNNYYKDKNNTYKIFASADRFNFQKIMRKVKNIIKKIIKRS